MRLIFVLLTRENYQNIWINTSIIKIYTSLELLTIKREDYSDWDTYYWTYQSILAETYYIPRLQSWEVEINKNKILDIGCGDGGFTAAFGKAGGICTGVEIREFDWKPSENVDYIVQDIMHIDAIQNIGNNYDLIILRDVMEHIPILEKKKFLQSVMKFGKLGASFLITFPPFYSPFGLHQQTLLKSSAKYFPYLSLLSNKILLPMLKLFKEDKKAIKNIVALRESKMTIRAFNRLILEIGLTIQEEEYFFVRPSHEIRYGWKMRKFTNKPLIGIRELATLGVSYLLSNSVKN